MKSLLLAALLVTSTVANAANLPAFNVTCPTDISVRAEAGGPVYINDQQATLHKFSEQYFEAKGEGMTVSVSLTASGTPTVSYTGKQGANGICEETQEDPAAETAQPTQPDEQQ
ncbi:hypothetical protein [Aquipseudomonas guryensis]|uniref:Uncharacterized protein n=1 Tax=Aquipseudomonas guryensis TaxID=2759165 RepID=A0A7W4D9H6_9GAMM|nr:hypothetical protein [Pseudomonas guryensis]MBB1518475.1 hypothetical protein [Pseudomonas guryensis]